VDTVTFSSVFSCNVFKKCRFQACPHENGVNRHLMTKTFSMLKTFSDKRFHVETLKIQDGGLKSKHYIFVSWKLRSFIGSLILKLKTLATNKTKCIAFQVYNDL
jgi:hypothetical protein